MQNYILSATSTADLSKEHFESRGIPYLCFHFMMDDVEHIDDLGQTMPFDTFYQKMEKGVITKTSQPSTGQYLEYFTPFLEAGKDILHVSLSSGLSGEFNNATLAAKTLLEKYPERKIIVIDSLGASSGYGLFVDKLADLRDEGMGLEELAAWAEEHKLNVHHWFFSTDLKYYVRGGRVSRVSGFLGGILHICPLLNMDDEGHLIPREKCRPERKAILRIVEMMKQHAENGLDYDGKVYISMSACPELAEPVAKLVEETFPKMKGKVLINSIGTTIGSHTGPGTVALFFFGDKRGH